MFMEMLLLYEGKCLVHKPHYTAMTNSQTNYTEKWGDSKMRDREWGVDQNNIVE